MASGTARSVPQPPPPPMNSAHGALPNAWTNGAAGGEAYIERQIRRTRRQVKLVDLATSSMLLAAGVLGYLLLVTLVDHWVVGLNFWARLVALASLLGGIAYFSAVAIWPLLIHPINPLYAARSIEQGATSLKNSLINFLLFRSHREEVHAAVYRTLEQKAASDLSHVPLEQTVDRSRLIVMGYVLAGVLAACAVYLVLSPKDTFRSVARVAAPWKPIARPSRVEISHVKPGDIDVFQGRHVAVSAEVLGADDEEDAVRLVYSTMDGQTVARPITMRLSATGLTYEAELPESPSGVQQDLFYRIEAGDAVSPEYRVTVSPAPVILVERVEYEFPAYMGRPPETVEREGDVRGLEGTRVTIRAWANQPIRSAFIEFDPAVSEGPATVPGDAADPTATTSSAGAVRQKRTRRQPLTVDGNSASMSFYLELQEDRRTPVASSYQLGFVTPEGDASENPVLHSIQVFPDLTPEIEILTPTLERIEVREDQRQRIEVRALDPDFGISKIELRGVAGERVVFDDALFEQPAGRSGQAVVEYDFVPARLGLTAGTRVVYWATVADNRTAVGSNDPQPNVSRTRNYTIEITPAPTPANSDRPPSPSEEPDGGEATDGGGESGSGEGEKEGEGAASGDGGSGAAESSDDKPAEGAEGQQEGQAGESPEGEGGSEGGNGQPQSGASTPGEAGERGETGGGSPQQDGQPGDSAQAGSGNADARDESLHDGEVFEKALERMRQQQASGEGSSPASGADTAEADQEWSDSEGSDASGSKTGGNDSANPGQPRTAGDRPGGDSQDQQPAMGDGASPAEQPPRDRGPSKGAGKTDQQQGAGEQRSGAPGEGGESSPKTGAEPDRGQQPPPPGTPDNRMKDPGMADNGDSGAGQNSRDTSGSGSVEKAGGETSPNRDREKELQPESGEPQEQSDPGTTTSKRQSDSQGGQSGEKSGGGKKGPGQGANQPGNDSAGQNSASDEGAGAASEAGDGETSSAAGDKQQADGPTGSAGSEKGSGSSTRRDPAGRQASDGAAQPPGEAAREPDSDPSAGGGESDGGNSGLPLGGGVPSDNAGSSYDGPRDVPDAEKANLEYARKATDMVLDYLKDQQDDPDAELLRDLDWTQEDLRAFLDRWEGLRRSANEGGTDDRRELDESLRSLGLRRQADRVREGVERSDSQRGLRESGVDSRPPAQYRERFDAFRKGASRVQPER